MEKIDPNALSEMQLVKRILHVGSITGAARSLGISPSSLSKQLSRVEQRLGVQLFERTTRRIRATSAGLRYGEHASQILAALAAAEDEIRDENRALRGNIRVTAPTLFGGEVLAPLVTRFLRKYPDIRLELLLSDAFSDLVKDDLDVAIRLAPSLPPSELLARRLGEVEVVLVASADYLRSAQPLGRATDLEHHRCVLLELTSERGTWQMEEKGSSVIVRVSGNFVSSSPLAIYRAARDGLGIAQLPLYLVSQDLERGRLVRVLEDVRLPARTVFALQPSGKRAPRRVAEFVKYLAKSLGQAVGSRVAPTVESRAGFCRKRKQRQIRSRGAVDKRDILVD